MDEVFKAGDYADRGRWSPEQLDLLAATYDPRLHAAPVVLGHPAHDAPAYAWVRRLRRAGQSLWAQLEKVDPAFEALLRAGRFAQRSVSLYTLFPATGGPYLRHLGFLGAAPPAVKGLAPVRFADGASVCFAFDSQSLPEVTMSEPKSRLDSFLEHLRTFFRSETGSGDESAASAPSPSVIPLAPSAGEGSASEGPAFSDRLAQLEQRLDALTRRPAPLVPPALSAVEGSRVEGSAAEGPACPQVANFVETLRARGRFPPAFDRWSVPQFMERLAAADATLGNESNLSFRAEPAHPERTRGEGRSRGISFSTNSPRDPAEPESAATEAEAPLPLLTWFQNFLTRLPAVIEFRELGAPESHRPPATGRSSPVVRFTQPRRGVSVDPASVELAERAEALAAELGLSYADALARLRQEHTANTTTA